MTEIDEISAVDERPSKRSELLYDYYQSVYDSEKIPVESSPVLADFTKSSIQPAPAIDAATALFASPQAHRAQPKEDPNLLERFSDTLDEISGWLWGFMSGDLPPAKNGKETQSHTHSELSAADRQKLRSYIDEMQKIRHRIKEITDDGNDAMQDSLRKNQAQLEKDLIKVFRSQKDLFHELAIVLNQQIESEQEEYEQFKPKIAELRANIDSNLSTANTLGTIRDVALGIGFVATAIGAIMIAYTQGGGAGASEAFNVGLTGLGMLANAAGALTMATKGVLDYENGKEQGNHFMLREERRQSLEVLKDKIEELNRALESGLKDLTNLAQIMRNQHEAARFN